MKGLGRAILLFAMAFSMAGCGSDNDTKTTSVTVFHASSDAPAVDVRLGSKVVISDADYKAAGQVRVRGTGELAVDAILPDGSTTEVIGPQSIKADSSGKVYDVFVIGKVADSTLESLVVTDEPEATPSDSVRVRIAHLASDAPEVDVYVTAPGADLSSLSPVATVAYKDVTGPLNVPAGDYQVRVTAAGRSTVVYDSGTVSLAGGSDLLVGAVNNTNYGDSPISLIVEEDGDVSELVDADAGAGLRAVHNSYNAPNVDIYLGAIGGTPAISNLAFPDAAPGADFGNYAGVAAESTEVSVTATGDTTAVVSDTYDLANGSAYTVLAANALAQIELLAFSDDDRRAVATEAKLRVIHGAGQAPNVDVYLTAQGAGGIGNADPVLSDVAFGESSGYLPVAAGDYDVYVTAAGTGTVAIGPVSVTLENGGVYTAVAREAADYGSSGAFTVTGLDDLAAP